MYASSPKWGVDPMPADRLETILRALRPTIQPSPRGPEHVSLNHGLHFTGGEPFLDFDALLAAVETAHRLGIPSLFAETNGYWAREDGETRARLKALCAAGLSGLLVSANPFILEYVPFEQTRRAARIGHEVFGQDLMVYQAEYFRRFLEMGVEGRMSLAEYVRKTGLEDLAASVELFITGRAVEAIGPLGIFDGRPGPSYTREPCLPAFIRAWHNHVDNYGNYIPGYCGGISLGDAEHLRELCERGIDLNERPVLAYLVRDDLAGLLDFARQQGYQPRDEYYSKCHLCLDIRRHLAAAGSYAELAPARFYEELGPG
jgi:hypothetical protein